MHGLRELKFQSKRAYDLLEFAIHWDERPVEPGLVSRLCRFGLTSDSGEERYQQLGVADRDHRLGSETLVGG
ncbi:MAG: hypothetical protein RIM72_18100 [Alphaproteobacteria bacterium]|jgi:hypothetical protein